MEQYIPVSGVVACHICPRRYYFERSLEHPESPRYTVCKQVSTHLGELLDSERIWQEVLCILPDAPRDPEPFDECIAPAGRPPGRDRSVRPCGRIRHPRHQGGVTSLRTAFAITVEHRSWGRRHGTDRPGRLLRRPSARLGCRRLRRACRNGICRFVEPQPRDRGR